MDAHAPVSSPMQQRASSSTASTMQGPGAAAATAPAAKCMDGSSTDPFLKDFTLVAEAAKRAQVAVLVRDLEGCGLS
ncbi:hypothetical protein CDD81_5311 [Ophiocordyceps australis]|uniref:Uncharacterized protein n=1 Tax=Ophiocordyceps australis TaxID=1399860 RepID=A0A2C5XC75_9HYPO|nr:hypothetical protein CDD81_5311 [Ophiocordyceps australis]